MITGNQVIVFILMTRDQVETRVITKTMFYPLSHGSMASTMISLPQWGVLIRGQTEEQW